MQEIKRILTIEKELDEKFLRQKTPIFDIANADKKEIQSLIKSMRETMKVAKGIGLSANQVGLNIRLFVVQIPQDKSSDRSSKFYAIFNPEITRFSKEQVLMEEGCLSVPGIFGEVERPERITIEGVDKNNKKIKIKCWGVLARVFQHELDHLNGNLFIDKAIQLYKA